MHKYAYVHGDPINGHDPSGNFLGSIGTLFSNASLLNQVLSVGFASLGVYDTTQSVLHTVHAFHAILSGDAWSAITNTAWSIIFGISAALNFATAVSVLKIPPAPPLGLAATSVDDIFRLMVRNPAFERWVIANVAPAAIVGVANFGLLYTHLYSTNTHPLDWKIRDSSGNVKASGHESSGGTTVGKGKTPTRAQQRATHTERKFIEKHGDKVKKGDIVQMEGRQPMCKPGNPRAPHGDRSGCQVHMQWFAKIKEATVYYSDELGRIFKIKSNGELVKPDGSVVKAPTQPPRP